MDINTANNIISQFGYKHNVQSFMDCIELLDIMEKQNMLSNAEKLAYNIVITEFAAVNGYNAE